MHPEKSEPEAGEENPGRESNHRRREWV